MKKIFVQIASPIFANNVFFDRDQNDMSAPWRQVKERLRDLGYDLTTADNNDLKDCQRIIFIDTVSVEQNAGLAEKLKNLTKKLLGMKIYASGPVRKLYDEAIACGMQNQMVLFLWENRAVCPSNFDPLNWRKFKKIMTWDDDLVDNKKFFKFLKPMPDRAFLAEAKSFSEKKLLVNISWNKYSSYRAELYSARRKTIAYFDKHYPNDFDLYGHRWNAPITRLQIIFPSLVKKYSTYRGITDDKLKTLWRYKFALAYENNGDSKGDVTEKIFDIMWAKCVPIYLGAPNVDKYVSGDAFIDRRKFRSDEDLADYLKNMTEEEYQKYISAGEKYLQSEKYKKFSSESFCQIVIDALELRSCLESNRKI